MWLERNQGHSHNHIEWRMIKFLLSCMIMRLKRENLVQVKHIVVSNHSQNHDALWQVDLVSFPHGTATGDTPLAQDQSDLVPRGSLPLGDSPLCRSETLIPPLGNSPGRSPPNIARATSVLLRGTCGPHEGSRTVSVPSNLTGGQHRCGEKHLSGDTANLV